MDQWLVQNVSTHRAFVAFSLNLTELFRGTFMAQVADKK
jgi:hypothetical protein